MKNIFGIPKIMDYSAIPACVFSIPECASGYTEQEAAARLAGYGLQVSFGANGKALSMGATDGLVKVLADSATGKVVGMHVLGAHADDLVHLGSMAVQLGLGADRLQELIYAHPTLSEAVLEAFYGLGDGPIHLLSRR